MKTFVITPHYDTPIDILRKCCDSVKTQLYPCTHVVVSDGSNDELLELENDSMQIIALPKPHGDMGAAARAIGVVSAIQQGAEVIAYLDADNWYHEEHLSRAISHLSNGDVDFVTTSRYVVTPAGEMMGVCPENDGKMACDTSCMVFGRKAFGHFPAWCLMDPLHWKIGDRVIWEWIKSMQLRTAHVDMPTVYYRSHYYEHYRHFELEPPADAKRLCGSIRQAG
jgi:glycosyltransferase involved in cell wall biosynthesis